MLIFFIFFFSSSHELLHMFELTSVSADQYVSLIIFGRVIVCVISCISCFFFFFSDGRFAVTKDHVRLERKSWFFSLKCDFHSR